MSRRYDITDSLLRALLDAVEADDTAEPGDFIPAGSLRAIGGLIGCDEATFQVMDPGRRSVIIQSDSDLDGHAIDLAEEDPPGLDLFWSHWPTSPACNYPQRTGDHKTVTRLSDFRSRAATQRTAAGDYRTETGVRHEMLIPLPPDGRRDERILMFRWDGSDFTERDVLVMSLLRPHLVALRRRHENRPLPQLTPRQLQILALVAAGCTNGQAARSLGVAPATVRKHLENAFERLEVSSRSAAIVKAMPLLDVGSDPALL